MSMSLSMKKWLAVFAAVLFLAPATTLAAGGRIPPDLKGYALQQYLRKRSQAANAQAQQPVNVPVASPVSVPAPVNVAPSVQ
jgi:hypothetical protein